MTLEYLDQLIAMLTPGCDTQTLDFVRQKLLQELHVAETQQKEPALPASRSDQQRIDVYASETGPCFDPNDPVNW